MSVVNTYHTAVTGSIIISRKASGLCYSLSPLGQMQMHYITIESRMQTPAVNSMKTGNTQRCNRVFVSIVTADGLVLFIAIYNTVLLCIISIQQS